MRLALVALVPLMGCTSILGIDGDYSLASHGAHGSTGGVTATLDGGLGGVMVTGTGGTTDTGGATDDGGTSGAGGATPPNRDAGCQLCKQPPNCMPGSYSGTLNGAHTPAVTVVGVSFPISADLSFDLVGSGSTLTIEHCTFKTSLAWGTFSGELDGTFDCTTQNLNGHISGQIDATPLTIPFDGTLTGDLSLNGSKQSHIWVETENGVPPPTVDLTKPPPDGTGYGSWLLTKKP